MCGRYTLTKPEKLAQRFALARRIDGMLARYNISPGQEIPAILDAAPTEFTTLRWGLVPSWANDEKIAGSLANARCETAADKPAFRQAFERRRCLVPADGFYEWQKTGLGKVPHWITRRDEELFALAGLWETWARPDGTTLRTVSLMTTSANAVVARVHDRMPVILRAEDEALWLDPHAPRKALLELMRPFSAEAMKAVAVSSAVNQTRLDGPELIVPVQAGEFRLEG